MKLIFKIFFFSLIIASCSKKYSYVNMIKADVEYLSSDSLQGRETGSTGEKIAAKYIAERFKQMNLVPKGEENFFQDFNFKPAKNPHEQVSFSNTKETDVITARNVIGFIDNNSDKTVVFGAHYDHLGYGSNSSLYRGEVEKIHNGADDNASGVALMLDLAGKLKSIASQNNYLFVAFSGEEMGLLGSNYFVKNPTTSIESINYMINMDMVGRLKEDKSLAIYGVGTSPIFKQTLKSNNEVFSIIENESGMGPSDHTSFYLADIPVLHFFTGQHSDYHKPSDDFEKINYQGIELLSNYIINIIKDLNDNGKLPFRATKNESQAVPRFKVSLGVMPDYLFDGEGMKIDGISADKPAQKAGILKGDIVIKLGGENVIDMMSYMKALSKFKSGESTLVTIKRGKKIIEKEIVF